MQHIDEGLLHWYVDEFDGVAHASLPDELREAVAHLETCETCRGRLGEARSLRDGASTILSGAEPRVDTPPFDAVVSRARDQRHDRVRIRWVRRSRALAMAATVVLAVGAGWMLRSRFPDAPVSDLVSDPMEAAQPAEQFAFEDAAREADRVEQNRTQPTPTREGQQEAVQNLALPEAPPAVAAGAGERSADSVALRQMAQAAPETERVRRAEEAVAQPVAADVDVVGAFATEQFRTVTMDSVRAAMLAKAAEPERQDAPLEARRMAAGLDEEPAWVTVDRATAEQAFGPLATIPAATIESFQLGSQFGTTAVTIRQRLGTTEITLLEWRGQLANEAPLGRGLASVADVPPGTALLVRTLGDLIVAVRADLPSDSLSVLVATLEAN